MEKQDLNSKLASYIETLATSTDSAYQSEQMQQYLTSCASFYNYSFGNQMLIVMQNPNASRVAGFVDWKKRGRFVKAGEHGIAILAPCKYSDKDDSTKDRIFFKTVYVFDVSQTDGEPLPDVPEWKTPGKIAELHDRVLGFVASKNIPVIVESINGDAQGFTDGKSIHLALTAGTKTLIHELAHVMLSHIESRLDHAIGESEAEAVAFVCASHFGFETNSANYIALCQGTAQIIRERLGRIQKCAAEIINGIETKSVEEN